MKLVDCSIAGPNENKFAPRMKVAPVRVPFRIYSLISIFSYSRALGIACVLFVTGCIGLMGPITRAKAQSDSPTSFAALIAQLSEPGGDFGGDNLISNEQSYLHVIPALEQSGVTGGAHVGVGPDQNFSYIAHVRPAIAYIVDIRRDNLLLHLLFKAVFAEARTRVDYLSILTGRPAPEDTHGWQDATIDAIVSHIDETAALPEPAQDQLKRRLEQRILGFGVPLTAADLKTIFSFRRQFVDAGLSLVFQARGQPLRSYYPDFRTLLRETDRNGRQLGFLATEPGFQFVRLLQARDLIVPVTGDVSGSKAMRAIAADMNARNQSLSVLYISNVEFYLFRSGRFDQYAENLERFPRNKRSVVVRSIFPSRGNPPHPQSVPGFYSTSIVQSLDVMIRELEAGKYRGYRDLVFSVTP